MIWSFRFGARPRRRTPRPISNRFWRFSLTRSWSTPQRDSSPSRRSTMSFLNLSSSTARLFWMAVPFLPFYASYPSSPSYPSYPSNPLLCGFVFLTCSALSSFFFVYLLIIPWFRFLGDLSLTNQSLMSILKLVSMDMVYPSLLTLRDAIYQRAALPFADVRGSWHIYMQFLESSSVPFFLLPFRLFRSFHRTFVS